MISSSHLSLLREIILMMFLSALLISALPSSSPYTGLDEAEDDANDLESRTSNDLERLRSLLTVPSLMIEYKRLINTPISTDLSMRKRYGFAGLDNLDVIHRVLDSRQPDNMAGNRESNFNIRQLMERHG